MDLIKELNKETLANEVAPVQIGDTVRACQDQGRLQGAYPGL